MKYIIIEDEPLAAVRVQEFAGRLPHLSLAATFENAVPAIEYLQNYPVDLIFLDVNIGEISGIQLLEIARPECVVIILSAYQEYALKGFELKVTDYLLKPFTFERFCQAVDRARSLQQKPAQASTFLFVKTQYRLEKVVLDELLYIEGARDYRRICTTEKELMTLETFGQLEKTLPPARFIRVHKSYLIALEKIDSLERDFVRIANRLIPVSETYKNILLTKLRQ